MSIFGSDNFGLSDSLIDAVKKVRESGIKIKTNQEAIQEKLSSKEKMKRGLYNDKLDPVGKEDDDIDNDGDTDSSDKYLKKRRMAIKKAMNKEETVNEKMSSKEKMKKGLYNDAHKGEEEPTDTEKEDDKAMAMKRKKKKADMKEPEGGADPIDTDPKMDDVKEANLKEDDVQAKMRQLMRRDGKDPDKVSDGGMFDRYRAMAKRELGMKESAGSRPQDKKDGDMKPVKQGASDLHNCAEKVMHENWGEGLCMFGEHAEPDENGQVAWYDVMFEHGIEKEVSIEDLKVISEKQHGAAMHSKRKKENK